MFVPGKNLTTRAYRIARKMRRRGESLDAISGAFNHHYSIREIEISLASKREYSGKPKGFSRYSDAPPIVPPQEVVEHKERRLMLRHSSLTALLLGDPLPGESALDRKCVA